MNSKEELESSQVDGNAQEHMRIIELHDLIEKNIQIEQQIESRSFVESISDIQSIISKANEITDSKGGRPINSTELVLDTELLKRNHDVFGKAIQVDTNFTDRMFCTAIAAEKRPTQSDKLERHGEGSTAVNHVLKQIKNIYRAGNNQPIPYFKLICNPNNFMDSVQNSLIISFLNKENLLTLEMGEDGLPQVRVNSNSHDSSENEPYQAISTLDVDLCKKYAKHYDIVEPMLKRTELDEN